VPRWVAFAALTLSLLTVLLFSARRSGQFVEDATVEPPRRSGAGFPDGADHLEAIDASTPGPTFDPESGPGPTPGPDPESTVNRVPKTALLANVAVSHLIFAAVLSVGIVLAGIPLSTLGIGGDGSVPVAIGLGVAVGLAIATGNVLLGGIANALEADPSGPLRELLAPDSPRGWALLLFVVLPIIAGFEELLFRGVLIGAFAAGFGLSPWALAVGSSVVFGAGHGAQGWIGIAATALLGFVLAAVFVLTGSLLVVVIAHYIVNAVEFGLIEGLGYEPFGG
jgi:membrane protease YdiL (CAAX protease family)